MATSLESRAGAARLGTPLMITSFLMVTGFLYWLSVTAKPTEIVLPDPEEDLVNVVDFGEFSTGPGEYLGKLVSLEGIEVRTAYGNHGHWINLSDAHSTGYLLHVSDSLRADTTAVSSIPEGTVVNLTGRVVETTDSVLDAWEAAGGFTGSLDRRLAESTRYLNFIEVRRIQVPETPPPGQGGDYGSGQS